ncbi:MAG: DUF6152 family protein [Bryobacteraceae bacterium]|jgi:hypothetical protein
MKARLALMVVLLGACAIPVLAHHSFAATYFEDKVITIEGDLVQFQFRNPHSFVDVAVKDSKGEVTRWAIEWGGGGQLSREGVTRETLKPGDHVIVTGNPGRNESDHRIRMQSITRPKDGWHWKGVIQ